MKIANFEEYKKRKMCKMCQQEHGFMLHKKNYRWKCKLCLL